MIDATGSPPQENVVIVVRDGRIVETRSATQADATNPSVIDLSEFHVLPGLMDVHAHLTMSHDPDLDYSELSGPTSGILGVTHEVGHALGFRHVAGREHLMARIEDRPCAQATEPPWNDSTPPIAFKRAQETSNPTSIRRAGPRAHGVAPVAISCIGKTQ